jgi:hypothetical protein
MSLCNFPQDCHCESCKPDTPGANWRTKLIQAGETVRKTPTPCTCDACEMGISMTMPEWLAYDARHPEIHARIKEALTAGTISVQGSPETTIKEIL